MPAHARLEGIVDVSVGAHPPHLLLAATESGDVHLLEAHDAAPSASWQCDARGGLHVGWAGKQPLAWNSSAGVETLWVLGSGGAVVHHALSPHADVAVFDGGFFFTAPGRRISVAQLAADGSISLTHRDNPGGAYEPGSLVASDTGIVGVRTGASFVIQRTSREPWRQVPVHGGLAATVSHAGTRALAVSYRGESGSFAQVARIDTTEPTLETTYPVCVLQSPVSRVEWSVDGRAILVYSSRTSEYRVFHGDGWCPGRWSTSAIPPRLLPDARVVTAPASRDRLEVADVLGLPHNVWVRTLDETPASFQVSSRATMYVGDPVLVLETRPRLRPTSLYQVTTARRKDDEARTGDSGPIECHLRVAFSRWSDSVLDSEQEELRDIARMAGAAADISRVRALLERNVTNESELEQLRVVLAMSVATNSQAAPIAEVVSARASAPENQLPEAGRWSRRWWRMPGELFMSMSSPGIAVTIEFTAAQAAVWELTVRVNEDASSARFDLQTGTLSGAIELTGPQRSAFLEQLKARAADALADVPLADPILAALATNLTSDEWTAGHELRRQLKIGIDEFNDRIARLMPRWVRKADDIDGEDEFSLTLPSLLSSPGSAVRAADIIETIYAVIAAKYAKHGGRAKVFEATDLAAFGLGTGELRLVHNVAAIALLIGHVRQPPTFGPFAMPSDAERLSEAKANGLSFVEYLTHSATNRQHRSHYTVLRPWRSAPLWIRRDGSQGEYPPMGFTAYGPLAEIEAAHAGLIAPPAASTKGAIAVAIPNYDLLERLGAGASGEVYRAKENRPDGIERAIKVFIPSAFSDERDPAPRFQSEARALYRLKHPAIVHYVHSGFVEEARAFFLVMDYVKGTPLTQRYQQMSLEKRIETVAVILDGLEHAHQAKIFHRDIKPSNIMIRDSDEQPVLVDFGLAYLVGEELDDDRTRGPLGTPGYIPPEASKEPKRSRDPRHDVYQAGVTLYEILMGQKPGTNDLRLEVVDARLRDLEPIVRKAIDDQPDTRYATAAAFAGDLRQWIARDARRQIVRRSAVAERLANRFSEKVRRETTEQQSKEARARAMRAMIQPHALSVEIVAVAAFQELLDSIGAMAPYLTLSALDPSELLGAEDEGDRGQRVGNRIAHFSNSRVDRTVALQRVRPHDKLWTLAQRQLSGLDTLVAANQRGQLPLGWIVTSEGKAQSPSPAVWGFIGVLVMEAQPEMQAVLIGLRRGANAPKTLEDEDTIKDEILEYLGEALGLER